MTSDDARAWCETISKGMEVQHILRDGRPYLDRFFMAGWSPTNKRKGPALFLHHFLASDSHLHVHSHPWTNAISLILAGGYIEHRCLPDGTGYAKVYYPGNVNTLTADVKHRIELLDEDCWTLFLVGHFEREWKFSDAC